MNGARRFTGTTDRRSDSRIRRRRRGAAGLPGDPDLALEDTTALVIGAGVGGLCAALALRRRGARATILEQADSVSETGAGLQISPNGLRVIDALGLGGRLRSVAVEARRVRLRDHRGRDLLALDIGAAAGGGHLLVHRQDLIGALADAAREADVEIITGARVERVEAGARPRVRLCGAQAMEADLVIGADGLHSATRSALLADGPPRFAGQAAWRSVVACPPGAAPEALVHVGPGRHVVSYPLRRGELLNIVAVQRRHSWEAAETCVPDDPERLRGAFADFAPDLRDLLGRVERTSLWGLFSRPVARRWHAPGVALLGDAAHPALPFLAQGACMALEDAWILADCLSGNGSRDAALALYQRRRGARTRRIVRASARTAWKYHLSFPPARAAAHAALRLGGAVAPGWMARRFAWIHGFDPVDGATP